ncbi:MAG: hypothetical protein QXP47_05915, partial [Candidatus Nezhaarchaeales archaeon]
VDGFIEILDIFKQFNQIASLPLELSENDSLVLDLYAHVSRLSALSRYASVKLYLRLCRMLIASAKAKCFNIYINCNRSSKLYVKLRATVDEEVPC